LVTAKCANEKAGESRVNRYPMNETPMPASNMAARYFQVNRFEIFIYADTIMFRYKSSPGPTF
jgi:hypothetical protein